AEGLYALYRALHDQVELTLGPNAPLLFATLSYPHLLGYSREACYPTSTFQPCATPPGPSAPDAGVDACFPVDRSAIDALDLGGRLDVLALSFYPDALEMRLAEGDAPESRAWPLADWNAGGACFGRLDWPDAVDPIAAIDRLGWTGPVGLAEVSVRSCPSPLRIDLPLPSGPPDPWVFEIAGSPAAQSAWVEHMLREANARDFLFYNHSFLRDYPPLGTWLVDEGILTAELQALFNLWPCSGLQDAAGLLKPELAGIVVPEPAPAEVAWVVVIGVAAAGARRALWQTRAVARGTGPTEGGIGIDGGSTRRRTRPEAGCASPHADG
ncbi:MAG TPA: hypothetical protein PLW10_04410, partial [Myxococcota bacterium]|nr:hypothetical protein [Myxococcota bacterium]